MVGEKRKETKKPVKLKLMSGESSYTITGKMTVFKSLSIFYWVKHVVSFDFKDFSSS